jgi:outer membrane lipoprotein-sorting protein
MKTTWKIVTILAAAMAMIQPAQAQTADQVAAKALVARGGIEKLKSVQSEKVAGRIVLGPDAEGPFSVQRERPHKMHMEMVIQGQTVIRIFDGAAGWQVNPFQYQGSKDVHALAPGELKNIGEEADFEGPLVNWKEKGNQLELMGKEKVGDRDAYRLKVTEKNGIVQNMWFDTGDFREIKWESIRQNGDKTIDVQSFFSDFRDVGGIYEPFLINSGLVGEDLGQKIVIEKVELNVPMDSALFKPPPASVPAAPADPKPH